MQKTKVLCTKCGATISAPETTLAVDITINTGCNHEVAGSTPSRQTKAEEKIEALRKAGVNVSNLFAIQGYKGGGGIGRMTDGQFALVPDDDPIFAAINREGTVPNRRLFRRWVMAQVFHMLTVKEYGKQQPMGFTKALQRKGYKYSWKMVLEELRVQCKLYKNDPENYEERNRWFNKHVVTEMAIDYITSLMKIVEKMPVRKCKKVPYIRLHGRDIFCEDLSKKVFMPLTRAMHEIRDALTPQQLYQAVTVFHTLLTDTYCKSDMMQSRAFKDAYKGAGAFFTMKNLILFHGCRFWRRDSDESLKYLNFLAFQSSEYIEGYKLFGIMKEFLADNHINIAQKQAEWRK